MQLYGSGWVREGGESIYLIPYQTLLQLVFSSGNVFLIKAELIISVIVPVISVAHIFTTFEVECHIL